MYLLLELLLHFMSSLLILFALLFLAAGNHQREQRAYQFFMPLVAVIYLIPALVLLYRFNDMIPVSMNGQVILSASPPVSLSRAWILILENVVVILVFGIIKFALRPIFTRMFTEGQSIGEAIVARIYEFVPDYNLWFVERRLTGVRSFFQALYWGSIIIGLLLVTLALTFSTWPGFSTIAFPAFAALVIGEIFFAIDGLTRREYDTKVLGEADLSSRVGNFGPLRGVLRQVFPDRVLSDGIHLSSRAALDSGHLLGKLSRSEGDTDQLAGSFFSRLRNAGNPIDVNLVQASVELLQGSSVLINNPFYPDLTPYLALPAYQTLLKDKKCLIVVGRDSIAESLVEWMSDGLETITGVPDLWRVQLLGEVEREGLDVGILRFSDIHNLDVLSANDDFLLKVGYIILCEPSRMMATGQIGLSLVLQRCSIGGSPTFAAFDRNHDGLVDALSHLLKLSLAEVVASALPQGASAEVVWRADGPHMHASILPRISRYLGIGTEIGAVAVRYHVSRVHWVGGDKFPVTDMAWIAGQYYSQINRFADLELSQDALQAAFVAAPNPWGIPQEGNSFLIVEDEIANVFETIRLFSTRATENGFVNLISEDYLLRDYMVSNSELFSSDPKAVPSIVSDFARTERNAVLRMILGLVTFGATDAELELEFELSGWTVPTLSTAVAEMPSLEPPVVTILRRAIAEHTGVTDVPIRRSLRSDSALTGIDNELDYVYSISLGSDLDAVIDSLSAAYFFVEDEVGEVNRIGSLLFGHVYQSLLPGQFLTYSGKYYEVQSISDAKFGSGVVLRRAAEHIHDRRVYRQVRDFTVSHVQPVDTAASIINIGRIQVTRCLATVETQSLGYLEISSRSALNSGRRVTINGLPPRRYVNKAVLQITLPDVSPRVRKTITLLLNELFVTTFPYSHQYVTALTKDAESEFDGLLSKLILDEDDDAIYIVEDSMIDLGLIVSVERYWERFLEIIADYLTWNASPEPTVATKPEVPLVPEFPYREEPPHRQSWFRRMWDRVRRKRRFKSADPRVKAATPLAEAGPVIEEEARKPMSEASMESVQEPAGTKEMGETDGTK